MIAFFAKKWNLKRRGEKEEKMGAAKRGNQGQYA